MNLFLHILLFFVDIIMMLVIMKLNTRSSRWFSDIL